MTGMQNHMDAELTEAECKLVEGRLRGPRLHSSDPGRA